MSDLSPALQWMITRKSASFLIKKGGRLYSTEANNLKGFHSYVYNGIVREQPVGIEETKEKDGIVLITRNDEPANKPGSSLDRLVMRSADMTNKQIFEAISFKLRGRNKHVSRGKRKNRGDYYRADLTKTALRKASALLQSQARSK